MATFKGGTCIDSKGYLKITSGPLRNMRVHILVAEAMLGRKLTPDETVHHRDFDLKNPSPGNLKVMGRSEHGYVSNRQAWFLKNRERHELAAWQEWIETGEGRPSDAGADVEASGQAEADEQAETETGLAADLTSPLTTATSLTTATDFDPKEFGNDSI